MKSVLEAAAAAQSMAAIQEAHLLVQLMNGVLSVLSDDDLVGLLIQTYIVSKT